MQFYRECFAKGYKDTLYPPYLMHYVNRTHTDKYNGNYNLYILKSLIYIKSIYLFRMKIKLHNYLISLLLATFIRSTQIRCGGTTFASN